MIIHYLLQWSEEFATIWIGPVPLRGSFPAQQVQRVDTDEHIHITIHVCIQLTHFRFVAYNIHIIDVLILNTHVDPVNVHKLLL